VPQPVHVGPHQEVGVDHNERRAEGPGDDHRLRPSIIIYV
jgi:hypothetical protein